MARLDLEFVNRLSLVDEPEVGDARYLVTKRHEPDDEATTEDIEKASAAGVSWTCKQSSGKIDESEIPNDDYESHYLFDADSKSESSYYVVGGDNCLYKENIASAYEVGARGGVSEEDLYRKLRALNDEFDPPPIAPEKLEKSVAVAVAKELLKRYDETEQQSAEPGGSGTGRDADTEGESMTDSDTNDEAQPDEQLADRLDDIEKRLGDIEADDDLEDDELDRNLTEADVEAVAKAIGDDNEEEVEVSEERAKEIKSVVKGMEGDGRRGRATQAGGEGGDGLTDSPVADAVSGGDS